MKRKRGAQGTENKSRKGQFFSLDVLFGATIFLVVLLTALTTWNSAFQKTAKLEEQRETNEIAWVAAQQLVQGPGIPALWENETDLERIGKIGLATTYGEFDEGKILRLEELNASHEDYDEAKQKLGAGKFELYVSFESNLTRIHEFGAPPPETSPSIVVTRMGSLNGEPVKMHVVVWK
ncbi:Uncharacterised protein [Candidatus Gugararchaeum adminiculabundum]|nr:Uncharacterised protein [Candidatus Gugararchaeum adminiculabundum]